MKNIGKSPSRLKQIVMNGGEPVSQSRLGAHTANTSPTAAKLKNYSSNAPLSTRQQQVKSMNKT